MNDKLKPNQEKKVIENFVECIMDDLDYYHFDELIIEKYKKELFQFFTRKFLKNTVFFHLDLIFQTKRSIMNDKEKIKKAAMFIDSFLVRTNTNLKKCASSKDLPEKESIIEILERPKKSIRENLKKS